jgi:probable phosphoglycerate mutase
VTRLYLIRHAENDWIGKRLPGWAPGLHLNDRGREQTGHLADLLAGVRFRAFYSSPLERALETAEPIAGRQGLTVETRAGLGEMNVGHWQGRALRVLRRRRLWPIIQRAPTRARFPGGESFAEAQARLVAEIESILGLNPPPLASIAVVSHADPIKLIIAYYLGLPLDLFQRLAVDPASVSILEMGEGPSRLLRLNHIAGKETLHSR